MAQGYKPLTLILLIVLVVAGAGGAAGYVYLTHRPATAGTILTVAEGDNVTVNYIGSFPDGPQAGRVFDTSIYSVATNNATYPKSLEFTFRGNRSAYTPFAVHVGPTTPAGGYVVGNLTFTSAIAGFWQGLIGLPGNKTTEVYVPVNLGYGPLNPACLVTRSLTYTVPYQENLTLAEFTAAYPNVTAAAGTTFSQPTYGWPVVVLSVNATATGTFVSLVNLPTVGWTASPNGWPVTVTAIAPASNQIVLHNDLTTSDAGLVRGTLGGGAKVCGQSQFIVSSVDPTQGTFTENYNPETVGANLLFTLTVLDIYPPR